MSDEIRPSGSSRRAATEHRKFVRDDKRGKISIEVIDGILRVTLAGEPDTDALTECFREALTEGILQTNMLALVDLMDYIGSVDWGGIRAIADMAPWGADKTRPSKVAYVTNSVWFAALMKLVSLLFPKSHHQQFTDRHAALLWLQTPHEKPRKRTRKAHSL